MIKNPDEALLELKAITVAPPPPALLVPVVFPPPPPPIFILYLPTYIDEHPAPPPFALFVH